MLQNNFYDDAYYIGGYALELCLKAKICKTLQIPDFFDFENSANRKLPKYGKRNTKENLYKPYKVHDFEQLLILSGCYTSFAAKIENDKIGFGLYWSIVSDWNENLRYSSGIGKEEVFYLFNQLKILYYGCQHNNFRSFYQTIKSFVL